MVELVFTRVFSFAMEKNATLNWGKKDTFCYRQCYPLYWRKTLISSNSLKQSCLLFVFLYPAWYVNSFICLNCCGFNVGGLIFQTVYLETMTLLLLPHPRPTVRGMYEMSQHRLRHLNMSLRNSTTQSADGL